jgi:hypothetical protein
MTILLESSKNYTYSTIDNSKVIDFPVYKLQAEPLAIDGIVTVNGKVIDDRNVNHKTLGGRRLLTPQKLVKDSKSSIGWYIDKYGKIIKYRKTRLEKLVCHRIEEVVYRGTYSILLLDGVNFPVEVARPPTGSYAQMLYYKGYPWKLYNILKEDCTSTVKKV